MAKSDRSLVYGCCFWSIVVSGIAILISWILGWCNVGAQVVSILNQIAHVVLMVGAVIGGIFYLQTVRGKYRVLWIVLFVIVVLIGVLGICINFGWFHF